MDPSEQDQAYFQAVEEIFVGLRGTPFLLAPADWQVARRWHQEGIPLDVVRLGLEEVFARRRERGSHGRVSSLRYCAAAVEAAWAERRDLTAPGRRAPAPRLEIAPRLAALAAALPAALPDREGFAARIRALAAAPAPAPAAPAESSWSVTAAASAAEPSPPSTGALSPAEVEERLGDLDRELLAAATAALPAAARADLDAGVETALAGLTRRLPAAELAGARDRLARQHLRHHLRLPLLSLFSPEAEPPPERDEEASS
jgi:hypothetical protein